MPLLPQNPGQNRPREGGRIERIEGGHADVCGHNGIDPRRNRCHKGGPLDLLQPLAIVLDLGQYQVRILSCIAMTGKVLGRGQHTLTAGTGNKGTNPRRHHLGRMAKGANINDGVSGITLHICHGGQEPIETQGFRLTGCDLPHLARQIEIINHTQGNGWREHRRPSKALANTGFEISAGQIVGAVVFVGREHRCGRDRIAIKNQEIRVVNRLRQ